MRSTSVQTEKDRAEESQGGLRKKSRAQPEVWQQKRSLSLCSLPLFPEKVELKVAQALTCLWVPALVSPSGCSVLSSSPDGDIWISFYLLLTHPLASLVSGSKHPRSHQITTAGLSFQTGNNTGEKNAWNPSFTTNPALSH